MTKTDFTTMDDSSLVKKTLILSQIRGELQALAKEIPPELDYDIISGEVEIRKRLSHRSSNEIIVKNKNND